MLEKLKARFGRHGGSAGGQVQQGTADEHAAQFGPAYADPNPIRPARAAVKQQPVQITGGTRLDIHQYGHGDSGTELGV